MQFANGHSTQALGDLVEAIERDDLGEHTQRVWLMLFDLYQHLGMNEQFDALGMRFLEKFERSPPVWVEPERKLDPSLATGGIGFCALTGTLSDASAAELEKLYQIGDYQHAIRIDFSKVEDINPFGAARLLEALHVLKASGKAIILTGEEQLLEVLGRYCEAGNRDTDGILWSLLLDVLQWLGRREHYEEVAVSYAVTYEVSPPSWESPVEDRPRPAAPGAADDTGPPAFRMGAEVVGARDLLVRRLDDWAAKNSPLVIDMSATRRVDLISAQQLLAAFVRLRKGGAVIQIRGANELVAALLEVVGIGRVARIAHRR